MDEFIVKILNTKDADNTKEFKKKAQEFLKGIGDAAAIKKRIREDVEACFPRTNTATKRYSDGEEREVEIDVAETFIVQPIDIPKYNRETKGLSYEKDKPLTPTEPSRYSYNIIKYYKAYILCRVYCGIMWKAYDPYDIGENQSVKANRWKAAEKIYDSGVLHLEISVIKRMGERTDIFDILAKSNIPGGNTLDRTLALSGIFQFQIFTTKIFPAYHALLPCTQMFFNPDVDSSDPNPNAKENFLQLSRDFRDIEFYNNILLNDDYNLKKSNFTTYGGQIPDKGDIENYIKETNRGYKAYSRLFETVSWGAIYCQTKESLTLWRGMSNTNNTYGPSVFPVGQSWLYNMNQYTFCTLSESVANYFALDKGTILKIQAPPGVFVIPLFLIIVQDTYDAFQCLLLPGNWLHMHKEADGAGRQSNKVVAELYPTQPKTCSHIDIYAPNHPQIVGKTRIMFIKEFVQIIRNMAYKTTKEKVQELNELLSDRDFPGRIDTGMDAIDTSIIDRSLNLITRICLSESSLSDETAFEILGKLGLKNIDEWKESNSKGKEAMEIIQTADELIKSLEQDRTIFRAKIHMPILPSLPKELKKWYEANTGKINELTQSIPEKEVILKDFSRMMNIQRRFYWLYSDTRILFTTDPNNHLAAYYTSAIPEGYEDALNEFGKALHALDAKLGAWTSNWEYTRLISSLITLLPI